MRGFNRRLALCLALIFSVCASAMTHAKQPNILVIWGDDVGIWNLSTYNMGMMGYRTPNIDRIASEGMKFTDYYGEQSCTAGRSAFVTGQSPIRTGLTKVGIPGADLGIQNEDVTLGAVMQDQGYVTAHFGKNHLGDKDKFLPTNHGFDEFFGNLYHLNAEEEPENPDYPQDPEFQKRFAPRGVIRSFADGRVEDSGPLTKKRMETIDEEFLDASLKFIDRAHEQEKPFFVWFNSTRMHYYTHTAEKELGLSGQGFYNDAMVGHDMLVGQLLTKLDELGIADDTIVIYTTDNGPHYNMWPDAAITPFRGEKNTNWEGGFRVPAMIRWPGKIKPGTISNEVMSHLDWFPTLSTAAGRPGIVDELHEGTRVTGKPYKVHLDGFDFTDHLTGKSDKGARKTFFYWSDDGDLMAMRTGDWKALFAEQRAAQFDVWREPFVHLRIPKLYHLRRDPFERADVDSNNYNDWWNRRAGPQLSIAKVELTKFLMTFQEFPQRQRPASFTVDQVLEKLFSQDRQ